MTFGIIGFGRFGKLWANCLKPFGQVLIYEKKPINDDCKIDGLKFVNLEEVAQSDLLFLLIPISQIQNCCQEISGKLSKNTIIVDCCSVKVHPVEIMKSFLPANQSIIATHPLFGPDSVRENDLSSHKIVVCPVNTKEDQTKTLLDILNKLKLKIIISNPQEHDKQMARSQALVHYIGRGLTNLHLSEQEISTPDYASLLKMNSMVSNDTWQLFLDMQKFNPYAKIVREEFMKNLQNIENKIN